MLAYDLIDALHLLWAIIKWTLGLSFFLLVMTGLIGAIWINLFKGYGVKVRSQEWIPYEDAKAQMRVRDYAPDPAELETHKN